MSKAEKQAKKRYWLEPNNIETQEKYAAYVEGYQQAEKDLELTWEDLALIRLVFDATEANINLGSLKISPMTKEFYQEVLKRFKYLKNENQEL